MKLGLLSGQIGLPGGGRSNVVPLAKELKAAGHEVLLFSVEAGRSRHDVDVETGVSIYTLGLRDHLLRRPGLALAYLRRASSTSLPLASASAIREFVTKERLEAVYSFYNFNALPLLLSAPFPRAAIAINLIGFGITKDRGGGNDTYWLQNEIFRRPLWDVHFTATEEERSKYGRLYRALDLHDNRLVRLPHPYDSDHFFYDPSAPGSKDDISLVYPVAVYPRKNIEELLHVVHYLKNEHASTVSAVVTGRITDRAYHRFLVRRANELGVTGDVTFLDGIAPDALGTRIRSAHAVYYPSFQETFGIGVVEALACGVPVVIPNDIPALREFRDLTGVTTTTRDIARIGRDVVATAGAGGDPGRRREIAEGVGSYSSKSVARQLVLALEAAHERKRHLASFDWEGQYGHQRYDERIFRSPEAS